jgi:cytochrome P450
MSNYLDQLDAILTQPISDAEKASQQAALVGSVLQTDPKNLFDELRARRPILQVLGLAVVSRFQDVVEVLERQADFTIETYTPKMARATGEFFLGMQDSAQYQVEVSIARLAARRSDLERIQAFVQIEAVKVLQAAPQRIDVVTAYSRFVPTRLVQDYFGVTGTPVIDLANWIRAVFYDLFSNLGNDPTVIQDAKAASVELAAQVDALIACAKATLAQNQTLPDTVLNRLIGLQDNPESALDDWGVRRNICGLVLGAVETTSRCVANVIDYFLDNPHLISGFLQLAKNVDKTGIAAWVFEALRLRPQAPFLYRIAASDVEIAKSTDHAATIPAKTLVFAGTWSAMLDPEVVEAPNEFRPGRPAYQYLHLGHGMHECFGKYINQIQIPELVSQVLQLPGLRRAAGDAGKIQMFGPFPDSLVIEWDA